MRNQDGSLFWNDLNRNANENAHCVSSLGLSKRLSCHLKVGKFNFKIELHFFFCWKYPPLFSGKWVVTNVNGGRGEHLSPLTFIQHKIAIILLPTNWMKDHVRKMNWNAKLFFFHFSSLLIKHYCNNYFLKKNSFWKQVSVEADVVKKLMKKMILRSSTYLIQTSMFFSTTKTWEKIDISFQLLHS